jgi:hypothetical protein
MIIRDVKSNNAGKCAKLWYLLYLSSNFSPKTTIKIIRESQKIIEHIHIELKKNRVRFGRGIDDNRRIL